MVVGKGGGKGGPCPPPKVTLPPPKVTLPTHPLTILYYSIVLVYYTTILVLVLVPTHLLYYTIV
jgi:hypothetical protein